MHKVLLHAYLPPAPRTPWTFCPQPHCTDEGSEAHRQGAAHVGAEAGIKTRSSCFCLFSTKHTVSEGSRELLNSAPLQAAKPLGDTASSSQSSKKLS